MTRDVIVVDPKQSLTKAWRIMTTERIRHLVDDRLMDDPRAYA